jgi:ribose transport system ATP-binding protein/rhamnose transport system ATP-binding protein
MSRLLLQDVRKSFGATAALRGVSLGVGEGEVHPLIGENSVSRVGWVSRMPCCASRTAPGGRLFANESLSVFGRIPQDAECDRRDAHPTRCTPLGFFMRRLNSTR